MTFSPETAALIADGEKLAALTGEDHGPWFLEESMTEDEARALLRERMGNDYFFLPVEAEEKWVKQIVDGTFFASAHPTKDTP
ncbi:hypothetical protein [Rhizobium rhizogenes]|uniref:hypothetical protein n=1 Tax=Rhizobium rhizogenes TaxID=359 RepID=UPI0004D9CE41|nr:hypothetical protein [Rhizobium rhizogenes]KEA07502.1 hypothetical protein CN09_11405 [Rhizobium rhizogenes]NTJ22222.1 hypothetical protein [Rhizobium rhizogenes]QUE80941.1 hypothetical protein EML492_03780 [Rhizobium rhizogenes]TQO80953.1 hypothetical protein FFE80_07625 [Rhizobium rhizogenes]TRB51547.1 hypothetical protein EXN69_26510 [Rhizobium rhizogenes]